MIFTICFIGTVNLFSILFNDLSSVQTLKLYTDLYFFLLYIHSIYYLYFVMSTYTLYIFIIFFMSLLDTMHSQSTQQQYTYEKFEKQFNRHYNQADRQKHKSAFEQNYNNFLQFKKVNPDIEVNNFMDWTQQQMNNFFNLEATPKKFVESRPNVRVNKLKFQYPQSLDYRNFGIISAVKDQGNCGSCWAFTTTAMYEANLMLQTNILYNLSSQYLLNCDTQQYGCYGGSLRRAINFINNNGAPPQGQYPNHATDANDSYCGKKQKNVKLISQAYYIAYAQQITDEQIIYELITHGPIAVGIIGSYPSFMYCNYQGMINDCKKQGDYFVNHAVVIIGYTPTHWIIKNSWGTGWGQNGFAYVNKSSNCGIKQQLVLFRTSMYGSLYPQNKLGLTVNMNDTKGKGWNGWVLAFRQKGQIIANFSLEPKSPSQLNISVHSRTLVEIIVIKGNSTQNSKEIGFQIRYSSTNSLIYGRNNGISVQVGNILTFFCPSICTQVLETQQKKIEVSQITNLIENISNLQFAFIMGSAAIFLVAIITIIILFFCCSAQKVKFIEFNLNRSKGSQQNNCIDTEKGFQRQNTQNTHEIQ